MTDFIAEDRLNCLMKPSPLV